MPDDDPSSPPPDDPSRGLRSRAGAARERALAARRRLEESRPRSGTVDVGLSFLERDRAFLGGLLAGALAFRVFLFFVPFTLVVVAAVGLFATPDPEDAEDLVDEIGLRAKLAADVAGAFQDARGGAWLALALGLAAAAYTSVAAMRALWLIHVVAWGEQPRPPRRPVTASGAFLAVNVVLVGVPFAAAWVRHNTPGLGVAATLVVMLVYGGAWWLLSSYLPHGDAPRTALWPGAVLVAVGAEILHLLTVYWLGGYADRYESVYGAIGVAAVILLWLYLISRMIVAAATLNMVVWERNRAAGGGTGPPPAGAGQVPL